MKIEESIEIVQKEAEEIKNGKGLYYLYYDETLDDRKRTAEAIETLLTAYEKEKEEKERIGKLYYETNESCIKYEKSIIKIEEILEKYKYTEIGNSEKIIEFYKELKSILSKEE